MSYTAVVGTNLEVIEFFFDDYDDPLEVLEDSLPSVKIIDSDRTVLFTVPAYSGDEEGKWIANIPIPDLNIEEKTKFKLVWTFQTEDETLKYSDDLYLVPSDDVREGDIVLMEQDPNATIKIPLYLNTPSDSGTINIYQDNNLLGTLDLTDKSVYVLSKDDFTTIKFRVPNKGASLEPVLVSVDYKKNGMTNFRHMTYNVWIINSSILSATHSIEDFINKARIQNVISELDYQTTDLLEYLRRGLNLFNSVQQITSFNGINMKGVIRECWIICSTYYALSAQLQAEGAMAFDFSGQTVNLNIDRTGPIESALGRIEGQIDNIVKPAKKQLLKAGVKGGDGSSKGTDTANNFGRLGVINAPTTRYVGVNSRLRRW